MSSAKTASKSKKKEDMAFVAPVVRKDYPIFMAGPVDRKAGKSPRTPKDPAAQPAGSQQSERRKRMEQHKERRTRRYPKKKTKIVLRKISEINEENEEELFFDEMQKGFTRLRRVTECSESEEEDEAQGDPSPAVSPQPRKKKLFGLFVWKPFSFKKKVSRNQDAQ